MINEGLPSVQHLNENINNAKVLADLKIMDAADYEVSQAVKFGADVVTILGVSRRLQLKQLKKRINMVSISGYDCRSRFRKTREIMKWVQIISLYTLVMTWLKVNHHYDLRTVKSVIKTLSL